MLLINLIAARRAERRRILLIRGVLLRAMIVVVGGAALGTAFMTFSIRMTQAQIRDTDMQMALLQNDVSKVERLQQNIQTLEPKVATLVQSANSTNRWRAVLQEVSTSLPTQTWITSFTTQPAPSDGFTLTGQTLSNAAVGKAMMQLGKQTYIKSVDLHFTQSSNDTKAVTFEMAGTLQPAEGASNGK